VRKLFGNKSGKKTGNKTDIKSAAKAGDKTTTGTVTKTGNEPVDEAAVKSGIKPKANPDAGAFKRKKRGRSLRPGHIAYASMAVVGIFFAAAALRVLIGGFLEDTSARNEYEQLRESFHSSEPQRPAPVSPDATPEPENENDSYLGPDEDDAEGIEDIRALSLDELAALNRDFKGWMTVGSNIDYPVVRGSDNSKYLNTTFMGQRNTAGAIFMDYRHIEGFDEQVCIIYGHNTRDGSMFSPLIRYLEPAYLQSNPNISITTRDGRKLTYRIFAAKLTDAWDMAYTIGITDSARATEFPDAPQNASRFLLLSTCTRGGSNDERVLVFAALV